MILTHIGLASLTIYLIYILYTTFAVFGVLCYNISLSSYSNVYEKLKGPPQDETLKLAASSYTYLKYFLIPYIFCSLLLTLTIWGTIIYNIQIPIFITSVAAGSIVTAIVKTMMLDKYPEWLYKWNVLLTLTHLQLNLEWTHTELKKSYTLLTDIKEGTLKLTESEEALVKLTALELSQKAMVLAKAIDDFFNKQQTIC